MFTGIIQAMARVAWVNHSPHFTRYAIEVPPELVNNLRVGASVSVHGICQTVVAIKGNEITFEAIEETLKRTTIPQLSTHQLVNVERSAKFGDEIGGHVLSGHIMGTAKIAKMASPSPEQRIVTFSCSPEWMKYILPKGFIALNGASLTVVDTDAQGEFTVHLIPETLKLTTFGEAQIGELINLEIDSQTQAIVATVERVLSSQR